MSYKHCDVHDEDATNGCVRCAARATWLAELTDRVYEAFTYEFAASKYGIVLDDAHRTWLRDRVNNAMVWIQLELKENNR